jgi:hypothetical protein
LGLGAERCTSTIVLCDVPLKNPLRSQALLARILRGLVQKLEFALRYQADAFFELVDLLAVNV